MNTKLQRYTHVIISLRLCWTEGKTKIGLTNHSEHTLSQNSFWCSKRFSSNSTRKERFY